MISLLVLAACGGGAEPAPPAAPDPPPAEAAPAAPAMPPGPPRSRGPFVLQEAGGDAHEVDADLDVVLLQKPTAPIEAGPCAVAAGTRLEVSGRARLIRQPPAFHVRRQLELSDDAVHYGFVRMLAEQPTPSPEPAPPIEAGHTVDLLVRDEDRCLYRLNEGHVVRTACWDDVAVAAPDIESWALVSCGGVDGWLRVDDGG